MARLLESKYSDTSGPTMVYCLDMTTSNRTPTSVQLNFTWWYRGNISSSWTGTGEYLDLWLSGAPGAYRFKDTSAVVSGTAWNGYSNSYTVSVGASDTSYGISCGVSGNTGGTFSTIYCGAIGFDSVTTQTGNCSIGKNSPTQASCYVYLSSLPSVSYSREIRWYRGGTKVATTSSATGTSYGYTFTGLLPNSGYTLKAEVYSGSTWLATKSVYITTPSETGTLADLGKGSTYINVNVTGMFNGPNYTRSIDVYYKRSTDSSWTKHSTLSSQTSSASTQITGLVSGATYSVYCVIRNGSTTYVTTATKSVTTDVDTSLVPIPYITSVTQPLGLLVDNKPVVDIEWMTDKQVSGTSYAVMLKVDTTEGEGSWTTIETMSTSIVSPAREKVTLPSSIYEGDVDVKIVASNPIAVTSNTSNIAEIHVMDIFIWDNNATKTQGQSLVITANEWNRLWKYVEAKSSYAGIPTDIEKDTSGNIIEAVTGKPITADKYNKLKNAISKLNDVGYADRVAGDEITAACIEALKTAINKH